jgi:hypothetical protein
MSNQWYTIQKPGVLPRTLLTPLQQIVPNIICLIYSDGFEMEDSWPQPFLNSPMLLQNWLSCRQILIRPRP